MLLVPPRHGKSQLASRRFPAFYLGHHPDRHFLSVSATADLAADFGRDVRNLISGAEYGWMLRETVLAADSHAKGKWHTAAGGVYYLIGIGGAVLGRGAHVMLIDDHFASMDEALSEATRKKVWDWYTGTAYNRLMPGGAIVVISHRMHEDDLAGRLLAQQAAGGDRWEVVELPAIDDHGMALWSEAYPIAALKRIRLKHATAVLVGAISAKADAGHRRLFQGRLAQTLRQSPRARNAYGLRRLRLCRDRRWRRLYGACHCRHGPGKPLYVLDLWREQTSSEKWIEAFCDLVLRWRPLDWAEEQGQIKASVGPFLSRRQHERKAYVNREPFPTRGDKAVRAQSIRGRMALEGLYVPVHAPWYPAFRAECSFPAGKHDDQVDALGFDRAIARQDDGVSPAEAGSRT